MRSTLLGLMWWALLTGLWLGLVSTDSPAEAVAGVLAGGIAAVAGVAAARASHAHHLPPRSMWRWVGPICLAVVVDTWRLLVALARRAAGRRVERHLRAFDLPADRTEQVSAGRRALATVVVSATPSGIVVEAGKRGRGSRLLVHLLGTDRIGLDEVVSR